MSIRNKDLKALDTDKTCTNDLLGVNEGGIKTHNSSIFSNHKNKNKVKKLEMKENIRQLASSSPYDVDREIHQLPNIHRWINRPLFFKPGKGTSSSTKRQEDGSLPFHTPVDFDGDLFSGKIFMRVRNLTSSTDNDNDNDTYFQKRRRTKQIIIQGQFKERISCDNVWFGDTYEKPLNISSVANLAIPMIRRLIPGVQIDFVENPRVMVLLGGESRTVSVDTPGNEPNVMGEMRENNTKSFGNFLSLKHRRKMLRNPKTASKYYFDPEYVYTFQLYDDVIDLCDYSFKMRLGKVKLLKMMNYQPFTFAARTSDDRSIFSFKIFHEDLVTTEKNHE